MTLEKTENTIQMTRMYSKGKGGCSVKLNAADTVKSDNLLTVFHLMDNFENSFPDTEIAIEVGFDTK